MISNQNVQIGKIDSGTKGVDRSSSYTSLFKDNRCSQKYELSTDVNSINYDADFDLYSRIITNEVASTETNIALSNSTNASWNGKVNYAVERAKAAQENKGIPNPVQIVAGPGFVLFENNPTVQKGVGILTTIGSRFINDTKELTKKNIVINYGTADGHFAKIKYNNALLGDPDTNPDSKLLKNGVSEKEFTDNYKKIYNSTMSELSDLETKWDAIYKQIETEVAAANGDESKIDAIWEKYGPKLKEIEMQQETLKTNVKINPNDPNEKVKIEKKILGNTETQISYYGAQAAWTTVIALGVKTVTNFSSSFFTALQEGKPLDESLKIGLDYTGENMQRVGVEAGALGGGTFAGLLFSKGNSSVASSSGIVLTNLASFGYSLYDAKSDAERVEILDKELAPTIAGSTGAIAVAPVPFLSGTTGNTIGRDIGKVINWANAYDDFAEFAANVSYGEVGSLILESTGAIEGDLIECYVAYHFTGEVKTTGAGSAVLSAAGSMIGKPLGEFGGALGEWYYDYQKRTEEIGYYIADVGGIKSFTSEFVGYINTNGVFELADCFYVGLKDILRGSDIGESYEKVSAKAEEIGELTYDFFDYVGETGAAGFSECWLAGFKELKELWLLGW